jgi:hypothetical protein
MSNFEKSLVGLPFYEKESQEGLDITLKNIDDRLNELDVDTSVIVQVNGPETAQGQGIDFNIDQSKYNAEIEVVKSDKLGQTRALNDLMAEAAFRGIQRAFMTDADIYRFPGSMKAMWEQADKPVVGARYRPYPVEVVEEVFGPCLMRSACCTKCSMVIRRLKHVMHFGIMILIARIGLKPRSCSWM